MAQALVEKLEHTGLAEWKRVASAPQSDQLARGQSILCQNEKEQSNPSKSQDHEKQRESKSARAAH